MLHVRGEFRGTSASDATKGDANAFIKSLLIEVATENYRQMLFESAEFGDEEHGAIRLDPPLRANERIMSGLFANALGRVAPRSRPEARIDRPDEVVSEESSTGDAPPQGSAGRVDFLAWYGRRVFAIELKAHSINAGNLFFSINSEARWEQACSQARTTQTSMRNLSKLDPGRFPDPVSLALMVFPARKKIGPGADQAADSDPALLLKKRQRLLGRLERLKPKPTFVATYTFPAEFRASVPTRRGHASPDDEGSVYTPFVGFAARVMINAQR